ncbi:polyhydroxyalkanoate depolymerase [Rhodospirillum rubrum]|uniref:intracellular poly(3-hydroxybutyrate) depolymerase PhaZ2 n=1 Tax=Rhodospirillum rubrum TaxID=1085 RepID=UPI0019082418|nr:polyhydroxyalkanoate depolymerase [Rhodospirillum rubrum]MBK1663104.1 polyhydroxyalkanoate depolymerase [Rhodospirillum rubrum]MBK1675715.1 polyhydroxyalkanoate depolymerase [Rhodospirillum rubrum]
MLYNLHEIQHAALMPWRVAAHSVHTLYTCPWVPASYTKMGRSIAAGAAVFERVTRRYGKPRFGLDHTVVAGERVWVEEITVHDLPFCDLVHFTRGCAESVKQPRLLVVAPLSGHYATLLRGTIEALLPDHDVYITDWINAREVPIEEGAFGFDTYIDYLRAFLAFLGPDTHLLAVCQPSVPVLTTAALMAEDGDACRPLSMTLMGGPLDTRINPTEVNRFADSHDMAWFEKKLIHTVPGPYLGRGRKVYPGFLQLSGFMAMNFDRHVNAHLDYFTHLIEGDGDGADQHRDFYDEYLSVMDLPAEFYLETVERIFKNHELAEGKLVVNGRRVDTGAITDIRLLTIEGERDDITGKGQTAAAHTLCANLPQALRDHRLQPKVGHYGIFNGRRWREEILPHVRAFILEAERGGASRGAAFA